MTKLLSVLFLFLIGTAQAHDVHNHTRYRNYWTPMYHGLPVAYCLNDGTTCGMQVATRYCQWMGYQRADHIRAAYNLGHTRFFGSRLPCKHWQCSGFKTIRCVGRIHHHPPPSYVFRKKRFPVPRYMGQRIDWCAGNGRGCGYKAAYSFCRRIGYTKTIGFARANHVGTTAAIDNQRVCAGLECVGFQYIDCYR
jgi:hypothetical protein